MRRRWSQGAAWMKNDNNYWRILGEKAAAGK